MLSSRGAPSSLRSGSSNFRDVCPVVSTDQELWSKIADIADLQGDDILVDIGCGDGRFIAHCAHTTGCRCIGLDVRASCLEDTRRSAQRWGVSHLVKAVDQDLMDLSQLQCTLSGATVAYCFLLPHIIRAIEPVLLQAVMEHGVRVVLFCASGGSGKWSPRQRDPGQKAGNALCDLTADAQACFGRLRCYGRRPVKPPAATACGVGDTSAVERVPPSLSARHPQTNETPVETPRKLLWANRHRYTPTLPAVANASLLSDGDGRPVTAAAPPLFTALHAPPHKPTPRPLSARRQTPRRLDATISPHSKVTTNPSAVPPPQQILQLHSPPPPLQPHQQPPPRQPHSPPPPFQPHQQSPAPMDGLMNGRLSARSAIPLPPPMEPGMTLGALAKDSLLPIQPRLGQALPFELGTTISQRRPEAGFIHPAPQTCNQVTVPPPVIQLLPALVIQERLMPLRPQTVERQRHTSALRRRLSEARPRGQMPGVSCPVY